jgi:hypothetical protein
LELPCKSFNPALRFLDEFKIKCIIEIIGKDEPGIEIRSSRTESDPKVLIDLVKGRFAGDFDLRIGPVNSDVKDGGWKKMKSSAWVWVLKREAIGRIWSYPQSPIL